MNGIVLLAHDKNPYAEAIYLRASMLGLGSKTQAAMWRAKIYLPLMGLYV
jgi:hypothetical protein